MKKIKILTVALATAALSGVTAMAQLNYHTGDLLVGFGTNSISGGSYVLANLGSIANFQVQYTNLSWNLSSVLSSTVGTINNGVYWSVFGVNDNLSNPSSGIQQGSRFTVWNSSSSSSRTVPGDDGFLVQPYTQIITLANSSIAAGTSVSAGVITAPASTADGFNVQMVPTGDVNQTWPYNITRRGANSVFLLQNDAANAFNTAQSLGTFSLSGGGVLTYNAVPEPSTWAMLGSGVLAFLAIRRRK